MKLKYLAVGIFLAASANAATPLAVCVGADVPGLNVDEMAEMLADPISSDLQRLPNVKAITSRISLGTMSIYVEIDRPLTLADVETVKKVAAAKIDKLPLRARRLEADIRPLPDF